VIQEEVVEGLIAFEAEWNLQGAKATAQSIVDQGLKDIAYFTIVKVEVKKNIAGAKETALCIASHHFKDCARLVIVEVEVHESLPGAKGTLELIENQRMIVHARLDILKVEILLAPELARGTAQLIRDPAYQPIVRTILHAIQPSSWTRQSPRRPAKKMPNIEALRVAAFAEKDLYDRGAALVDIIKIEAVKNVTSARKTVRSIQHLLWRALGLLEIAKVCSERPQISDIFV
jgi:hypothetical protein